MIDGHKLFAKGERVYQVLISGVDKTEQRVYATVTDDEIPGHDYISVEFDNFPVIGGIGGYPGRNQVVLSYYLFRVEQSLFSQDDVEN